MKFTVHTPRPRNPLVAACHQRQAGAHRRPRAGVRQMAERALQGELRCRILKCQFWWKLGLGRIGWRRIEEDYFLFFSYF